jgi:hypothetical protein
MVSPKVAICIPSGPTWCAATAMSVAVLVHRVSQLNLLGAIFNEQTSDIALGRNGLVARVRAEGDLTHILWIDSDQVFPSNGLERLLAHDRDVVGCFYSTRMPPYRIVGQLRNQEDWDKGGLAPAIQMPGGFVLVKMDVYDRIGGNIIYEEWFDPKEATPENRLSFISDDSVFTRRALAAGCEVFCDIGLSKEIGHVGSSTSYIHDRKRYSAHDGLNERESSGSDADVRSLQVGDNNVSFGATGSV